MVVTKHMKNAERKNRSAFFVLERCC